MKKKQSIYANPVTKTKKSVFLRDVRFYQFGQLNLVPEIAIEA